MAVLANILNFPQRGVQPTPKDAWISVKDDYTRYLVTQGRTPDTIRTHVYNAAYYAAWLPIVLPLNPRSN